jgi:hypothetical protein
MALTSSLGGGQQFCSDPITIKTVQKPVIISNIFPSITIDRIKAVSTEDSLSIFSSHEHVLSFFQSASGLLWLGESSPIMAVVQTAHLYLGWAKLSSKIINELLLVARCNYFLLYTLNIIFINHYVCAILKIMTEII